MKIAIMQPYFLPYLGYWQLIHNVDTFVIFDNVNFIKKNYINHNSILVNRKPYRFTLPLRQASQNKKINMIEVALKDTKLLKTIEIAYKKAPYFHDRYEIIRNILTDKESNLARFIGNSIKIIAQQLSIETHLVYASELDYDTTLFGEEQIIAICKAMRADEYINPIGGRTLYKDENFIKNNISLQFLEFSPVQYQQFGDTFYPNLSIVDIMMFNSFADIQYMLTHDYQMIKG